MQCNDRPDSQLAAHADLVVRGHLDRFIRVTKPDPGTLHHESRPRVLKAAEQHRKRIKHMGNRNGQHRGTVFARLIDGLGPLNALAAPRRTRGGNHARRQNPADIALPQQVPDKAHGRRASSLQIHEAGLSSVLCERCQRLGLGQIAGERPLAQDSLAGPE